MPKLNKTINTTVLEQVKSGLIIALIVGIASAYMGIQFQKANAVTVQNTVTVQSTETKK